MIRSWSRGCDAGVTAEALHYLDNPGRSTMEVPMTNQNAQDKSAEQEAAQQQKPGQQQAAQPEKSGQQQAQAPAAKPAN